MPTPEEHYRREVAERLVRLEDQIGVLERAVRRIVAELGPGLPEPDERTDRSSVRHRLHELENDKHAERIARSALAQASQAKDQEWSTWQKLGVFAFAAVAAASSVARMFGVG